MICQLKDQNSIFSSDFCEVVFYPTRTQKKKWVSETLQNVDLKFLTSSFACSPSFDVQLYFCVLRADFFFRQMNNKKWKKARVNETRKKVERSKKVEWYLVSERTKFPRRIDRKIKKRVQPAAENASLWVWAECSSLKLKSLMCFFWLDILLLLVLQRAVFGSEEWTFGGKSWTAQVEVDRNSISHKFSQYFHLGPDISLLH